MRWYGLKKEDTSLGSSISSSTEMVVMMAVLNKKGIRVKGLIRGRGMLKKSIQYSVVELEFVLYPWSSTEMVVMIAVLNKKAGLTLMG